MPSWFSLPPFKGSCFSENPDSPIAYKVCKFRRDRSIMKGTLLEEQSTFSAVRLLPSNGFS